MENESWFDSDRCVCVGGWVLCGCRRLPHFSKRTYFLLQKFKAYLNDSLFVQIRCSQHYVSPWSTARQLSYLMPVVMVLQWYGVFS